MLKKEQNNRSPWISAWSDPVAGVNSFSQLMCLSDLKDDGDYKYIVADHISKTLKVFMGTNVLFMTQLPEVPTALTTFYEHDGKPALPIVAVASLNSIFYF